METMKVETWRVSSGWRWRVIGEYEGTGEQVIIHEGNHPLPDQQTAVWVGHQYMMSVLGKLVA